MPSIDPLQDLFGLETLNTMVERFAMAAADPINGRKFTREFRAGERIMPLGESVHWDEVEFSRDLAPIVGPDSPSESTKKTKITTKSAVMVDVKEHVDFSARELYLFRNAGELSDNARAKVDRELRNLTNKVLNTVEYMCTKACEGQLDLSTVPNSKLNQVLNYPVQQIASSVAWSDTANAFIRSVEIPDLKDTFIKASGHVPVRAIAQRNVEGYVTGNQEITNFLASGPALAARALESSFLDGGSKPFLGGITWDFTNAHYALNSAPENAIEYLTEDRAIVMPSPAETREVLAMAEGRVWIPSGRVYGANEQALSMLAERRGFWAYASVIENPPGIRLHVGWKGLPIIKLKNAIANYDTTP